MKPYWRKDAFVGAGVLLTVGMLAVAPARSDDKSAALYKQKCATCHGPDGKGETAAGKSMKVRSFADPDVTKMSDDELAGAIEKGKSKMPPYGKSLDPEQIKELVSYIRSLAKK